MENNIREDRFLGDPLLDETPDRPEPPQRVPSAPEIFDQTFYKMAERTCDIDGMVDVINGKVDLIATKVDAIADTVDTSLGKIDAMVTKVDAIAGAMQTLMLAANPILENIGRVVVISEQDFERIIALKAKLNAVSTKQFHASQVLSLALDKLECEL